MWVIPEAACEVGLGKSNLGLLGQTMERFGFGPHTEAGCAAHSLWPCFGKTLVPWQKKTSDGESWEKMLQIQALQKSAEQPDVLCKVFQGLQRALH